MNDFQQIALLLIGVVRFFIIVHFIMSWLINFQVLNIRQPFVYQVWSGLNRLMEPIYAPIRSVLPSMAGIDLSPLVALIGVEILRILII
ncbi:YggT family protein [Salibaculum sp.]|uniref:YggT family protein n=1 Tax=Salibaculum sp. TaxID=2855480 RepID=UPI002B462671|nr:YggT family protein [Salibaculum sp.]HKL68074.1 YggT family protein [Salibaculum sp.]